MINPASSPLPEPTNPAESFLEYPMDVVLQPETVEACLKVPAKCVSGHAHRFGLRRNEPLIIIMDGLIRYARAYKARFDSKLSEDYVLGPEWLAAAKGIRGLLNGDGAVAMERGITADSKDNGAVESMFWSAMALAGFTEADL